MPEQLILNNIGNNGLASDPMPWTLPPEFITYGINFRISSGSIIPKGGVAEFATAPASWFPANLFHTGALADNFWVVMGRTKVYALSGAVWTDITSAAGYGSLSANDELLWSSCLLGEIPIINNPQAHPEYWAPQEITQILQPLDFDGSNTWLDKGYNAKIMRSHKNFLFALNLTESATEFPDSYRWSHPADINGLPATWDETDEAFLAGKSALGGNYGDLLDGKSLRDAFALYSESGINILDYTNDEFVWRRRELSATVGLLTPNCIVEVKGTHFLLGDGDIVMNDGNRIDSIIHNRIRKELFNRLDTSNYNNCYAVRNNIAKEAWFCIPEVGETYPNIAYIYNWKDNSWAVKDIPGDISFSNYGIESIAADTWDTISTDWDDENKVWSSSSQSPIDSAMMGIDTIAEKVYIMDPPTPDGDFNCRIERIAFPLISDRQVTTITRVYPHIEGPGLVDVQFGSHDYPDSPVRWKPAVRFDPNTQRKVDIRTTGELHAWRFDSVGKSTFTMSGMTIEFERAGLR
jgi:hypothetical protein